MTAKPLPKRPPEITSGQRKHLRGLAHDLEPVVMIGKDGVTEEVTRAVGEALEIHELIKVRVLDSAPEARKDVGALLAEACGAHEAGTVGRIVILYRRHASEPKVPLRS
jgi:RNA-binding protein